MMQDFVKGLFCICPDPNNLVALIFFSFTLTDLAMNF